MREDLRPGFDEVRRPLFQRLGDPAMQGLARAAQQAAVRRILYQRVLEGIDRVRRRAALKDQLGCDEPVERGLQPSSGKPATACTSAYGNRRPIAAPICATRRTGARRSSRSISESCNVVGIAKGGSAWS